MKSNTRKNEKNNAIANEITGGKERSWRSVKRIESGITLIALVITIIILLILAGITINFTVGDTGLFSKVKISREKYVESSATEEVNMAIYSLRIDESTTSLTNEEKRKILEEELKKYDSNSTVSISETGFKANHRGYNYTISDQYSVEVVKTSDAEDSYNGIIYNSYVEYDVGYTDIYTGTDYTKNTGWRLLTELDDETENSGTYTGNIEIISTGIPAGLYYKYNYIKITGYNEWAGTDDDITNYLKEFNMSVPKTYQNMYAASGLYYHFDKINFKQQSESTTYSNKEYNNGYYTNISKNGVPQSGQITGEVFIARSGAKVRSVTLRDINSITSDKYKKTGLFTLEQYSPDAHNSGYYWLATPFRGDEKVVPAVKYSGYIEYGSNIYGLEYGVRPVVSMTNVTMKREENVWKITN